MKLIEWVDASPYADWIRNSDVVYPLLQVGHILGISIVVGSLMAGNVRLLGVARDLPSRDFSMHLYRWTLVGLVLFLLTGVHMALAFLPIFAVNPVMGIKMGLLALAVLINLYLYRWQFGAEAAPEAGSRVKGLAVISVVVLLSIIVMGKLLAYIGGKD